MKKWTILGLAVVLGFCFSVSASAITEKQKSALVENCEVVRQNLKNVQKKDSQTRVFLGQRFETVLSKFIIPLNLRLVENSLSNAELLENQKEFATLKASFASDFVAYQQELENLIVMDCRAEPEKFYEKLELVRGKRGLVLNDVLQLKKLITGNIQLVEKMKVGL